MSGTNDAELAAIAELQAGVVSRDQLLAAGLTAKQVKHRLRRGSLQATAARGVYTVGGSARNWQQALWVALLAGPDGTLASHVSAAALRGLIAPPSMPQVTVPRGASGRFGGAVVHHGAIPAEDRGDCEGIAATALGRTLVDCASVLDQKSLNRLVDAAFGRHLVTNRDVSDAWRRMGAAPNGDRLRAALAPYAAGAEPGSVGAASMLRRLVEWGLPAPVCEYEVRDEHGQWIATVDFAWPAWWFLLEYDGGETHGPRVRRLDARRQAQVERIGFRVERGNRFDLRPSARELYGRLHAVLGRPPTGRPWTAVA